MTPNFWAVAYMLHICWWYSHDMKQASGAGKENCMLHKRDRLTKTISSSRSDARVENSCSRWQRMHLILSVCFDLLRAPVRWELFASGHVRLCHAAQQTQSCAVLLVKPSGTEQRAISHTVVHGDDVQTVEQLPLVLVDSLHVDVKHGGRVDFHAVLLLQVLGELHLVVLWEKSQKCDEATEMLLIEVKELIHRLDLSGHELTLKPQHCKAQMTQILMCAPALTCRNFAQPREGFHYFFFKCTASRFRIKCSICLCGNILQSRLL